MNTLWTILVSNIPLKQRTKIQGLYNIVQSNYKFLTADDLTPVSDDSNELIWHNNLRVALQNKILIR